MIVRHAGIQLSLSPLCRQEVDPGTQQAAIRGLIQLWRIPTNSLGSADSDRRIIETQSSGAHRMGIMYKTRMRGVFFWKRQGPVVPLVHL